MGVNFEARRISAKEFETELFEKLKGMGFYVALNGTEHTHPDFVKILHSSTDTTSLFLRYQPDGVAAIGKVPRSFFVEAKNSKTIEKNAYLQYVNLVKSGNVVIVVFKPFNLRWCFAEDMPVIHGDDTISRYPASMRFPVDEDGWICPRHSGRSPRLGSGTPYREVDDASLKPFDELKKSIIQYLFNCQSVIS